MSYRILPALLLCPALAWSSPHEAQTHAPHAHWSYLGQDGPSRWGALEEGYHLCGDGHAQSPVNIPLGVLPTQASFEVNYTPSPNATVTHNGHSLQVDLDGQSTLTFEGRRYALKQFHFHAESEHTIDGAHWPMEIHLVHADESGHLLVLGVLVTEGAAHPTLAQVFGGAPAQGQAPLALGPVDPASLLPESHEAWRYHGSLTTPPCTEGVEWLVLSHPITTPRASIDGFAARFPHSFRPAQPLNGRLSLKR